MTPRRAVLNTLLKVTEEGAFANLAAKEGLSDVQPNSIGRSTALLYTTIEHLSYCDYMIAHYAKGRLQPAVRGILRLAVAELMNMDTPPHAVVNESVKLTAEIGKSPLKGYVNGVLRSFLRDREIGVLPPLPEDPCERLAVETGYPRFFIEEFIADKGLEFTEAMLKTNASAVSLRAVRPNSASDLKALLDEKGVEWKDSCLPDAVSVDDMGGITGDEAFAQGAFTVQSIGAMLACRCLVPEPGMNVLDCCAAPGGKTAYLFDLMQRKGSVTAWDVHPHRVELILSTMKRLGIACVSDDDSVLPSDAVFTGTRDASKHDPELDERFDALLCDVPCSGLGGGTKPDARYRRTKEDVAALAELQYSILDTCSAYLKPGCALVYSTCTLTKSENEGVVNRFLDSAPGFELESLERFLPDSLAGRGKSGMLTLYPHIDGVEGFFIARIVKRSFERQRDINA